MLWNFISRARWLLVSVLLAGCATTGVQESDMAATEATVPADVQQEYLAAVELLDSQADDEAVIKELEKFIADYPEYPGGYVNLAIAYERVNKIEQAVWLLGKAIEIDGSAVEALNLLAIIKRREGKFAEAEAAWLQATEADPSYAFAWYNLGILYDLYLQDLPAALDHYRRYEELTGEAGDPLAARWVKDLERRLGQPARAAQVSELP